MQILIFCRSMCVNLLQIIVVLTFFWSWSKPAYAQANSENTHSTPSDIVQKLLRPAIKKYLSSDESWAPGGQGLGLGHYLQEHDILVAPPERLLDEHYAGLPAPPDSDLLHALSQYSIPNSLIAPPKLTLDWISARGVGGIYAIEGSGACQWWVMLRISGKNTKQISLPRILDPPACWKDGEESHFGVIGGSVVAIRSYEALNSKNVDQINVSIQVLTAADRWTNSSDIVVDSDGNVAP